MMPVSSYERLAIILVGSALAWTLNRGVLFALLSNQIEDMYEIPRENSKERSTQPDIRCD